jgi:hypothetical protein
MEKEETLQEISTLTLLLAELVVTSFVGYPPRVNIQVACVVGASQPQHS